MKHRDDLIEHVREQLNREVEHIDYATQLALKQAREKALAQINPAEQASANTSRLSWGLRWKMMAGAAASIMFVLAMWWLPASVPDTSSAQEPALYADLELLATEEPLELYEDLDFYLWLADHKGNSDSST